MAAMTAIVILGCGCSSRPSSDTRPTTEASGLATRSSALSHDSPLASQLLQISDLPGEWQVNPLPIFTDAVTPACLRQALGTFQAANVGFTAADGAAVVEGLASLGTTARTEASFRELEGYFDGCRSVHLQNPDGTQSPLSGTLARAPFESVGDQSILWRIVFGDAQLPNAGSAEFVLFRRGSEVGMIGYLGQGSGEVSDIQPFTQLGIAKVPR